MLDTGYVAEMEPESKHEKNMEKKHEMLAEFIAMTSCQYSKVHKNNCNPTIDVNNFSWTGCKYVDSKTLPFRNVSYTFALRQQTVLEALTRSHSQSVQLRAPTKVVFLSRAVYSYYRHV